MRLKLIFYFLASILLIGFTVGTGIVIYYFLTTLPKVQNERSFFFKQVIFCLGDFLTLKFFMVSIKNQ
jgi:hypothetical protein